MGAFHTACAFIVVIGKRFGDAGLGDLLLESGVIGSGSLTGVFEGKHYNRALRLHKIVFEAFERLRWEAFGSWLNSNDENEFLDPNFQASVLSILAQIRRNLTADNFKTLLMSPYVGKLFEAFSVYCNVSEGPMKSFWNSYIEMVELLLLFTRATREGNWELHLACAEKMLPWFFAYDSQNYSRYMSFYLLHMQNLPNTHPDAHIYLSSGGFCVQRSSHGFSRSTVDQTIEQTLNRDTKTRGGIVGFSLNKGSVKRWLLNAHERASISSKCRDLAGMVNPETSAQKELGKTRMKRDETDVLKLVQTLQSWTNPFETSEQLSGLSSGTVVSSELLCDLLNAYEKGKLASENFITERLIQKSTDIFKPIKRQSLLTFSTKEIKGKQLMADKNNTLKADRNLFGRLLVIAQTRQLDMREVLQFELGPLPWSLANVDGTPVKTNKSVLAGLLEKGVEQMQAIPEESMWIFDGMAVIQSITRIPISKRAPRIDFVTDQYPTISIKNLERDRRSLGGQIITIISRPSQSCPRQWKKFLSVGRNKVALVEFFVSEWSKQSYKFTLEGIDLFVSHGSMCNKIYVENEIVKSVECTELLSKQEESYTKMFLHAKHAADKGYDSIVIKSSDTDVEVLACYFQNCISSNIIILTGTSSKCRLLNVQSMCAKLGENVCRALPGFHAFTGCDSVSALSGKGKSKAFGVLTRSVEFSEGLSRLGETFEEVGEELSKTLERFLCAIYGYEINNIDELRFRIFCNAKNIHCHLLPPTKDTMLKHMKRANFQAKIWKSALEHNTVPSPNNHDQPPALDALLILISCSCKAGCANKRCSCVRQALSCTDGCKCSNACSNKDYQIVDIANDDDEDDGDDDDDKSVDAVNARNSLLNLKEMEFDKSVLEKLSAHERLKINRQLRQKQIESYLRFVRDLKERDGGSVKKPCKPNRKNTRPFFPEDLLLQDAVENFDDKEVTRSLQHGSNHNFRTGNGTSLLHKCASDDNAVTAAILINHGADINIQDDDWWTPLHAACSCDSVDMVQLLLNNGADISLVDVDGFFAGDHCQDGSECQQIINNYMETHGLDASRKKEIQLSTPRQMYKDVHDQLSNGGSPNKLNENKVSLLHIACANGYKKVIKLLMKHGADMNIKDNLCWTPLHVASRFNQLETVKTLIKQKADLNALDNEGNKPSAIAGSNEIKALLLKRERKTNRDSAPSELDVEDDDDEEDEDDGLQGGEIIRINSKTVKPRHSSVGKMDSLLEGRQYISVIGSNFGGQKNITEQTYGRVNIEDKSFFEERDVKQDDSDEEEIYVSKIWKTAGITKIQLPKVRETDNLKNLSDISEESVLSHIEKRYKDDQIYTKIGDVLLAVNPFKELSVYAKQVSTQYHKTGDLTSLPPHLYSTAEEAYGLMVKDKTSQCCVISGESGAGKSETCKLLVQHLARVTGSEEANLNSKINQVNPLLEAFGNAQTMINDNSSRFAKFIELMFSQQEKLVGAKLTEFLLEKSRVVYQNEGERNFHIFYWMFSGLTPEEFNLFHLHSVNAHRYVRSRFEMTHLQNQENKEKFWDLKKCLGFIGFSADDIENLLLTLAAVIHIGDITFFPHSNTDAATIANESKIKEVSSMLDVSPEELSSALVAEYTTTRGEQIKKDRTVQQASDCRDALAKAIYSRLFSWIVNGINQLVEPTYYSIEQCNVGILDIFGFENFKVNSFEQICINLANEQMQNFTNEHLFNKEQQDCMLEGIQLVDLTYKNNQSILDTFMEKHTGVFAILDEESRFPKATDLSLAAKLHQGPGKKFSHVYKSPKDGGSTFTIVHFAGAVSYNLLGTLDKNRDTLPNSIMYTMKTSNSLLIKDLFQSKITRTGSLAPSARQQRSRRNTTKSPFEFFKKLRGGKTDKTKQPVKPMTASERKGPATMAYHFKCSLSELMIKVQSSTPHIIRCLKPNTTKEAMTFIPEYVLAQLRYTGISETIKIKKFGYPYRIKFHDFVSRYKALMLSCLPSHSMIPDIEKCKEIFKFCVISDGYQIISNDWIKTKVFMTDRAVCNVDKANDEILKKIVKSQSAVRRHKAIQIFKEKQAEFIKKQAEARARKQAEPTSNQVTEEILHTFDDLEDMIDNLYTDAISYRPYEG
ncbi:unnamed protein product [Mytilus coruscus]|nr:unnamed protein product [Mytilus coruscus]